MIRLNIALLPRDQKIKQYLFGLADAISQHVAPFNYQLRGAVSLAHISVCQFVVKDEMMLEELMSLTEDGKHDVSTPVKLVEEIDCKFIHGGMWLQLLPEPTEWLTILHGRLQAALAKLDISCVNRCGAQYEPHVTLLNTLDELTDDKQQILRQIDLTALQAPIDFELHLGLANEAWELTRSYRAAISD